MPRNNELLDELKICVVAVSGAGLVIPQLYDDENQPNLADAIAALARNVQSQGDGSRTKV